MASFVENHPLISAGIAIGVLILLIALLNSCSEKPTKEEIDNITQDIKDQEQRAKFVKLLMDDDAREALKGLISAA